jgi:hypothetical protein
VVERLVQQRGKLLGARLDRAFNKLYRPTCDRLPAEGAMWP